MKKLSEKSLDSDRTINIQTNLPNKRLKNIGVVIPDQYVLYSQGVYAYIDKGELKVECKNFYEKNPRERLYSLGNSINRKNLN